MENKKIKNCTKNHFSVSSINKKRKCNNILNLKTGKLATQNWEVTTSSLLHKIVKYNKKDDKVELTTVAEESHKLLHATSDINILKCSQTKDDSMPCRFSAQTTPSIIKMSPDNVIDNVFNKQCKNVKIDQDIITPLKSLMIADCQKDISGSLEDKRIDHNSIDQSDSKSSFVDRNGSFSSKLSDEQFTRVSNTSNSNGSVKGMLDEYHLIVKSQNMGTTSADIYELSGFKYLVVIKPECYFYLVGVVELELLKGCVEILGYNLNRKKHKLMVFSTQGSSYLSIKAKNNDNNLKNCERISFEQLLSLGLSPENSKKIFNEAETSTLFTISRRRTHISSSVWPKFFENHLSFCIYPPNDLLDEESRPCHNLERRVDCIFDANMNELGLKEYFEVPEWSLVEEEIISHDSPKTVLCGGKSVGKSTLLRYLLNKCLHKWNKVLVIDFDLGQCEFTVGGCISVTLVEEPVLGPNYSHLKKPLRSVFLGEVDVTKCPESYIDGCKSLITFAKENHDKIPWLINTMGFTKGIGITLTCGIIQTVNPTYVIQIQSKNRSLNFPSDLSLGYVYCQNVGMVGSISHLADYKLLKLPSGAEQRGHKSQGPRGISPAEARNLVILSYFSEMLSSKISSLSQVTPYLISMDHVHLQTTNKYNLTKAQLAATMNGNMVALCSLNDNDAFPNCHGFGIIRGIDWQTATMYLITPLSRDTLRNINCLVKGNIALPESLHYNQGKNIVGHIPYLAHTSGKSTSKFAKRDFRHLPVTRREDNRSGYRQQ